MSPLNGLLSVPEGRIGCPIEKMDTAFITRKNPIRIRRSRNFTVDPIFRHHLTGYDLRRLGASRDTVYLLDEGLCIRGFNSEYVRFARRNGGRDLLRHYGLGAAVLEGFTAFYAAYYRSVYQRCLDENRPYSTVYGSPSSRAFRRFRQTVEPLDTGIGLLVSHRLIESLVCSETDRFDPQVHLSPDGLILKVTLGIGGREETDDQDRTGSGEPDGSCLTDPGERLVLGLESEDFGGHGSKIGYG